MTEQDPTGYYQTIIGLARVQPDHFQEVYKGLTKEQQSVVNETREESTQGKDVTQAMDPAARKYTEREKDDSLTPKKQLIPYTIKETLDLSLGINRIHYIQGKEEKSKTSDFANTIDTSECFEPGGLLCASNDDRFPWLGLQEVIDDGNYLHDQDSLETNHEDDMTMTMYVDDGYYMYGD